MPELNGFVDIHCHLVPGIDDGAKSWDDALEMARIAVADGISTTVVTPHQLGGFAHNDGASIRQKTHELQQFLRQQGVPLQVLPGADVRIESGMIEGLRQGTVLSLADHRKQVLLELPHELYFPLEPVLNELSQMGMVGILSHPERNQGLLHQPELIEELVRKGCLMQVTAGSLMGTFGPHSLRCSEWMVRRGLVHFIATDAHGPRARRPLMRRAFERFAELADEASAWTVCCSNPHAVATGQAIAVLPPATRRRSSWLPWRKAA